MMWQESRLRTITLGQKVFGDARGIGWGCRFILGLRAHPRTAPCDIGAYDTDGNPTITKVKPAKGALGTKVTIKGTHLSGATAVSFNGTTAKIKSDSVTSLTTKVPAGATTGPISVATSVGGTVTSSVVFKVT